MKLLKILPLLMLLICLIPARTFAEMPKIEAGQQYFDVFKGYFVLKDKVRVEINNHGRTMIIAANEAKVNVPAQKCWAEGNVKLTHNQETFSCDSAYMQWKTKTAEVVGNVKFNSNKVMSVTAEKAIFNWDEKIVDFYDNIKIKGDKNLKLEKGLKIKKKVYSHIRYNVIENKILMLEEKSDTPDIEIPDPDEKSEENLNE